MTLKDLSGTLGSFTFLGNRFSLNVDEIVQLNYPNLIDDFRKIIGHWSKRKLTEK